MRHLLVCAGEPSGDMHAAAVVHAIRQLRPAVRIDAVGGNALLNAGAHLVGHIDQLSAIGTIEAVTALPRHVRLLRRIDTALAAQRYDAVLLVDYPGFHLRVARCAARRGIPVVYYIAPQLWAWGRWRTSRLRSDVQHLAVILPFEEPFFRERGISCTFVGHPLLDRPAPPSRMCARRQLGIDPDVPVLAVFPGSRVSERRRLCRRFLDAAERLRGTVPDLQVIVGAAPVSGRPGTTAVHWIDDATLALMAADTALCKSGTITLEAALCGTPMVVAYRMHPTTFRAARRLVHVPAVSLVNLIAGRNVVPELLQGDVTPQGLCQALQPLLQRSGGAARAQRAAFGEIRDQLGSPGAGRRVAELVLLRAA